MKYFGFIFLQNFGFLKQSSFQFDQLYEICGKTEYIVEHCNYL